MTGFLELTLLAVIFLVPLLGTSGGFGYEQVKVLFFVLSISLIGFLWMGRGIKWTGISKMAGMFILILLATSLTGIDPKSSLLGREPYFQGWVLYVYLFLFYLMVKTFQVEVKKYTVIICVSALLVAFLAIKDWFSLNILNIQIPTYAGRVVATFGQPNFYAGFLLLVLPFSYLLFKDSNKKLQLLGWGSGIAAFAGIMVSFSRIAILLSLLLLILGLLDQLKVKLKLGLAVLGILAVSLFLAFKFSSGIVGNEISQPILTKNPDLTKESVEKRIYIWPQMLQIAWQKPLTGYGLENIGQAVTGYFEENKHALFEENLKVSPVLISLKELNIDRTHNYLLDLLLFSGLPGLLAWMVLVGLLFWKLKQNLSYGAANVLPVGLATYLVWVQFQNQSVVHLIYFWLLVGLVDQL